MIDRLTVRTLAVRSLILCVLIRATVTFLGVLLGMGGFGLEPGAGLMLAPVVGGVFLIDLHATRETTFLANLGVGARHAFAIAVVVTIAVEIVIAVIALLVLP
jgi:hypothetical protein